MKRKKQILYTALAVIVIASIIAIKFALPTLQGTLNLKDSKSPTYQKWEYETETEVRLLESDAERMYLCEVSGRITAIDKLSGQKLWSQPAQCPHNDFFFIPEHHLLVSATSPTKDGSPNYFVFDTKTGDVRWTKSTQGTGVELIYKDTMVIEEISGNHSRVFAVRLSDGAEAWSVDIPVNLLSTLRLDEKNNIIFAQKGTFREDILFAIQAESGTLLWEKMLGDKYETISYIYAKENIGMLASRSKTYLFDLQTGEEIDVNYDVRGYVGENINVGGKEAALHVQDGTLYTYAVRSGEKIWSSPLGGEEPKDIQLLSPDQLLIVSEKSLSLIDTTTGKQRWIVPAEGIREDLVVEEGLLYFPSYIDLGKSQLTVVNISDGRVVKKMDLDETELPNAGKTRTKSPIVVNGNVFLIKSDMITRMRTGQSIEEMYMNYVRKNLATGENLDIVSLGLGENVYRDDQYFYQYMQNKVIANP